MNNIMSHPMLRILRQRQFLYLWMSEGLSVFGDQFHLIALPWLVLQITGDGLAMGTVLGLAGVPRALLMLAGGAYADRFSSRNVMLVSLILRWVFVVILTFLVISGQAALWMLYLLAFAFGTADAFYYPAETSIVPRLVEKGELQAANSLVQIVIQLSLFAGPMLAGLIIATADRLIAWLPSSISTIFTFSGDLSGIGLAFAMNALALLLSILLLLPVRERLSDPGFDENGEDDVLKSIRQGLQYVWKDGILRLFLLILSAINFLFNGPVIIGIPLLADKHLPEGAAAFGMLMSAFGGGSLFGTLLGGILPKPSGRSMGLILMVVIAGFGLGLLCFGFIDQTVIGVLALLFVGIGEGYIIVMIYTWLQYRTPSEIMGRVMSLYMFASVGITPVSEALSGGFGEWNLRALFIVPGILLLLIMLWTAARPEVLRMGDEMTASVSKT